MFYKYKLHHLCFFGLIKALRAVLYPQKVCGAHSAHTLLPPKVWNLSNPPVQLPFNASKMHYLCAVKWTLCYSFKAKSLFHTVYYSVYTHTAAWLCDPLASVLPYRLWQILSGCWEADLQSLMRAIFALAQVWLKIFFQYCNSQVVLNGDLMWAIIYFAQSHGIQVLVNVRIPVLLNHVTTKHEKSEPWFNFWETELSLWKCHLSKSVKEYTDAII